MSKVDPIPKGFHTITPVLVCKNAHEAIDFYIKAFGAEKRDLSLCKDTQKVMHAELKIGNSIFMLNDEFPEMGCKSPTSLGGAGVSMCIYVENADALFERAVKAGGKVTMPIADMFWGDRYGQVEDPYGHKWAIATHIKDLTEEEVQKGVEDWAKQAALAK